MTTKYMPREALEKKFSRRMPMVRWYNPFQLASTGVDTLLSDIFGTRADQRQIEALAFEQPYGFDYTQVGQPDEKGEPTGGAPREEIWLDYVADTGDGWNSTYTVANALAEPALRLRKEDGETIETKRGSILVMGGDMVYPVASREEYQRRLVFPFEAVLHHTERDHPHLYAIPGNHDWYDGLVAFMRLFCTGRWLGGWKTQQSRSYFALKLPHRWWLVATDVQLHSDIDREQVKYFQEVMERMKDGDRIILVNAEPFWIYTKKEGDEDPFESEESNFEFLRKKVFGNHDESEKRVPIGAFIAGDLHHYRRHEDGLGIQKITAGGGGAFLHPTHTKEVQGLKEHKCYPNRKISRRLTWWNLAFLRLNPRFGLVTGLLYALTAWTTRAELGMPLPKILDALHGVVEASVRSPASVFWILIAVGALVAFADKDSTAKRVGLGVGHAVLHLAAIFFIGWAATYWTMAFSSFESIPQLLAAGLLTFAGGYVIGPLIMGIYLLVALNVLNAHANESFSALAHEHYKSFLRLHIGKSGALCIYPIGIERVSQKWKIEARQDGGGEIVSDDPKATEPELIEGPIPI